MVSKFNKKRVLVIGLAIVMIAAFGSAASSSNSILTLNGGNMDTNGNDIVDSGTVVWDSSNGYVPSGQVDKQFESSVEMEGGFKLPTGTDAYN